ncbi:unnamed protein product [Ranitomeya imitator]|uniref:Uncharacterized protein n=1 Tax=Ranitomeya imitator TaxID=111125 RepID=A0ABN9LDD8_9NEOB|nr:unnamed protein product [Ranitomeya imitator]
MIVCWGGHSINEKRIPFMLEKSVINSDTYVKLNICTGCGPGAMEAPMKSVDATGPLPNPKLDSAAFDFETLSLSSMPATDVNTHSRLMLANAKKTIVEFPIDNSMNFHADNLSLHEKRNADLRH